MVSSYKVWSESGSDWIDAVSVKKRSGAAFDTIYESFSPIELVGYQTYTNSTLTIPDTADLTGLTQAGDLIIYSGSEDGDAMTQPPPAGFTLITQGAVGVSYQLSYKFATSSSEVITNVPSTGDSEAHLFSIFRNVNQGNPFHQSVVVSTGATGVPDPSSLTSTIDNTVFVVFGFLDDDLVASTTNPPTDFTLIGAEEGTKSGSTVAAAYKALPAPTTVDPGIFSSTGDDQWVAASLILNPE